MTPDKPFFVYFAPGATHAPHHVPADWIAKWKGKFEQGWDQVREETLARQIKLGVVPQGTKLAAKPAAIKDWETLSADEKRLFSHQVEDMLKHIDQWGSPATYPHMAAGWAVALNTPFMWTKQVASNFGGTRNGMVAFWPKGIQAKGELRSQFSHVIDVAPTILAAAGLPEPKVVNGTPQIPMEGKSLLASFNDAKAPTRTTQYFEIAGNRAVYHDGWLAGTIHRAPWEPQPRRALEADVWELYHVTDDFSCTNDLAAKEPAKLKAGVSAAGHSM